MNRVYKVIWSKAKHCYVVTSEIARSVTKSASSARSAGRKGAAVLAMAALLFTTGGMLGEAANPVVTDVIAGGTASEITANVITITKDDSSSTSITIDNVANAKEALKAYGDGDGHVIKNTYVKIDDAKVEAGGTYVNKDNTVGKNLSALDRNLSALDAQVQANADAVAAEAAARKAADQNNLKVGDDGVISKVTEDGTTPSAVKTLVLNKEGKNQITLSEDGIKVGLNSGVMDKDGFYAGGDDYEHASAALKWDGSIKGADGKFTVDKDGNADIGGDLTVDKNLTVNGTFDSETLSSTVVPNINYTTINGGKTESKNLKIDVKTHETLVSASTFDETGSNAWAKDDDSIGESSMTADKISQSLSDKGDNPENAASRVLFQNKYNKYEIADVVSGKNGTIESIINQTETGIKSTATDGKNTASTNLSNGGFNTYATDGTNKTYTKQTAMDIKNTAKNGTISNTAKGLVNTASENMTNNVGKNLETTVGGEMKTTVTGKTTENYNGGLETTVNGEEKHTVNGKQTNIITGDQVNTVGGSQTTTVTGDSSLSAKNINNTAAEKLSNSAAEIENTASKSIIDKVGKYTSWKMTDGTVVESVEDASGKTNKTTTTAADTYQFVKDGGNTLAKRTSSTNDNLNITDGTNTYIKITTATGNKQTVTDGTETASTNLTKSASNTLIENGTQRVLNHMAADTSYTVMNEKGNGSRRQQTASEILDRVTDGTNTSEVKQTASEVAASAKDISNTAKEKLSNSAAEIENTASKSIISQIGDGTAVKSEMTADGITNTAKGGTISNKSKDILNEASGDIMNFADGEIGNVAAKITNITGDNTVTSDTNGTTFENKAHSTAIGEGTVRKTTISGNTLETGKATMDYAEVMKDLDVRGNATVDGNTTLGKEGADTTLIVNSTSTFNKDVTMKENATVEKNLTVKGDTTMEGSATVKKNLTVEGETNLKNTKVDGTLNVTGKSTFNDKVSITKGGLAVTGGTTTDTLNVAGETRTGTLHVNGDGYVGGNLNVDGNIETHDAVLSADSRQVVTGRQLYQTNERVDRLDNRIKKVGANAAALAALRPGDFNPDDKFSIAAGFGSYRNASAAALGLFYRPNENVILSLGTSFGDGENMVNAGVSVKFGRGKSMAERRKEMADEVSVMRDEMKSQNDRIAELEEMLKKQSELIEKLSKES